MNFLCHRLCANAVKSSLRIKNCLGGVTTKRFLNEDQKSTMSVLNEDLETGLMINSYSKVGFRLNNGMLAVGPIAIFPKTVLSWNVSAVEDINEESLSLFYTLEPKIDILVIGVGDRGQKINLKTIEYMQRKNISLEILPTDTACATFNFLNAEGRCVAGALIPPFTMRIHEDDLAATQRRNKDFLKTEDEYLF